MIYLLVLALCVAADQVLKLWTVANLALYESTPLLPGIVELRYIQNTGGGFSILTGHTWLLAAVTAVLMLVIAGILVRKVYLHSSLLRDISLIVSILHEYFQKCVKQLRTFFGKIRLSGR